MLSQNKGVLGFWGFGVLGLEFGFEIEGSCGITAVTVFSFFCC